MMEKEDWQKAMATFDTRQTHDKASLKALGGIFYDLGDEKWCDTAVHCWRLEGKDLWVRQ